MSDAMRNKAALEAAYGRWHETRGGCLDEIVGLFSDHIKFGSLAEGAAPATFTAMAIGKAQMRGYFDGLLAAWTMNYYKVDHIIAEGDRVAVVGSTSWTNKATGKICDTRSTCGASVMGRPSSITSTTTPQKCLPPLWRRRSPFVCAFRLAFREPAGRP